MIQCNDVGKLSTHLISNPPSSGVEDIFLFLSLVGCHLPTGPNKILLKAWHYILATLYLLYVLFFVVFGTLELIYKFSDYLWIIYFTMVFKCAALRVAIVNIRRRLKNSIHDSVLAECNKALIKACFYLKVVLIVDFVAILFHSILALAFYGRDSVNIAISLLILLGTVSFVCYMSGVVVFSVLDCVLAQNRVIKLVDSANEMTLDGVLYDETCLQIASSIDDSFWVDGIIVIGGIINTVSAIAVLLLFGTAFRDEPKLLSLSFLLYVLTVLWAPDIMFFLTFGPEMAEVNAQVGKLQVALADVKRGSWEEEVKRYDALLKALAKPIRFTVAGFYLDHNGVWTKAIGSLVAILFSVLRIVIMINFQQ